MKVANYTGLVKHTVMIDFKMCCLYVVLVLPGSVEYSAFLSVSTGT